VPVATDLVCLMTVATHLVNGIGFAVDGGRRGASQVDPAAHKDPPACVWQQKSRSGSWEDLSLQSSENEVWDEARRHWARTPTYEPWPHGDECAPRAEGVASNPERKGAIQSTLVVHISPIVA
jgi:hypothetical protein